MHQPHAFYFTDETRGADPLKIACLLPTDTGIIYRHYAAPNRKQLAGQLAKICKRRNIALFISKTPGLAASIGATGCHLPEAFLPMVPAVRRRFPQLYISAACHSKMAVLTAEKKGVDLAFLSPVFATKSHEGAKTLGILQAAAMANAASFPLYALGGMTQTRLKAIEAAGFAGFGAIGMFED